MKTQHITAQEGDKSQIQISLRGCLHLQEFRGTSAKEHHKFCK